MWNRPSKTNTPQGVCNDASIVTINSHLTVETQLKTLRKLTLHDRLVMFALPRLSNIQNAERSKQEWLRLGLIVLGLSIPFLVPAIAAFSGECETQSAETLECLNVVSPQRGSRRLQVAKQNRRMNLRQDSCHQRVHRSVLGSLKRTAGARLAWSIRC